MVVRPSAAGRAQLRRGGDGRRRQSRETFFFWNLDTRRIEFHGLLDQGGGYGAGTVEVRDGVIHMNVKIVGNPGHPPWRAQIREQGDEQAIQVEALKDGRWGPFGTLPYKRQRRAGVRSRYALSCGSA